jgi:TetR/AcrR family transcriptional repressor of nem operon
MRITRVQAAGNRARVIDAAAKEFRRSGFDQVAVVDLMRAAGLTHGGFYNHFASKTELEAEVCASSFDPARAKLGVIAAMANEAERLAAFEHYADTYLSDRRRQEAGPHCPMIAFASEVSRKSKPVQVGFAAGLRRYIAAFAAAHRRGGDAASEPSRSTAIFTLSAMVGALALARSIAATDKPLSDEILAATRQGLADFAGTSKR